MSAFYMANQADLNNKKMLLASPKKKYSEGTWRMSIVQEFQCEGTFQMRNKCHVTSVKVPVQQIKVVEWAYIG